MLTRPLATYLAGAFLARLADEAMGIGAALLALERTGSAANGAAVLTAWMAPHIVAAPLTGALAARTRRPRLFYATALVVVAGAIAAVGVLLGRVPLLLVLGAAAVGGCCGPLVTGGLSSAVAALTTPELRPRAYALDSAVYNAASLAGPAAVTVLTGVWSAGTAIWLLAASAAGAALLLGSLRLPGLTTSRTVVTLGSAFATGLIAIWRNGVLRGVTAGTCVAYVGIGALPVAAVLVAGTWAVPRDGGVLMAGFAAGGLAGALLLTRWRPAVPPDRLAGYCLLGSAPALGLVAASPHLAVGLFFFVAAGLCDGPLLSATLEARSQHAPDHVRPQVFTIGAALKISAAAGGASLVGLLADAPPRLLVLGIAATQLAAYAALKVLPRLAAREPEPVEH